MKRHLRYIVITLAAGALCLGGLAVAFFALPSAHAQAASMSGGNTVQWSGQGADSVTACTSGQTPYLHWIFTTGGKSSVTSVTLYVSGDASGSGPMSQHGGSWSRYTPYSGSGQPTTSTVSAHVTYTGSLGSGKANLVISSGCYGSGQTTTTNQTTTSQTTTAQTTTGQTTTTSGTTTSSTTTTNQTTTTTTTPSPPPHKHHKHHHGPNVPPKHKHHAPVPKPPTQAHTT